MTIVQAGGYLMQRTVHLRFSGESRLVGGLRNEKSSYLHVGIPYHTCCRAQVYRVIRVILESSLESEILRTLRTPNLSDNETLKTLRLRVFGSLGLWHTSDSESLRV